MSVNPGFGGQTFIPRSESKVQRRARAARPRRQSARRSKSTAASISQTVGRGRRGRRARSSSPARRSSTRPTSRSARRCDAAKAARAPRSARRDDASADRPRESAARVRVRYAETDQMGVVYYANYLVWFEVGRTELAAGDGLELPRDGGRRDDCCRSSRRTASTASRRATTTRSRSGRRATLLSPVRVRFDYEVVPSGAAEPSATATPCTAASIRRAGPPAARPALRRLFE